MTMVCGRDFVSVWESFRLCCLDDYLDDEAYLTMVVQTQLAGVLAFLVGYT
jgi:hypothetical protein